MKNTKKIFIILFIIVAMTLVIVAVQKPKADLPKESSQRAQTAARDKAVEKEQAEKTQKDELHPMAIKQLRKRDYPGGDFVIEKTLPHGSNYQQFITSYRSEGLKIYGLLTVPLAKKPEKGFPAIVFVHGHIPPKQYSTTGSYPSYQAALARAGFVTFKPDLRGHGQSEGESVSAHFSEKYVVDTMQAISYLKKYKDVDQERLGYWGHSNGGEIGLRVSVISLEIKAYSLWAGVVGTFEDELETYNDRISFMQGPNPLVDQHGLPSQNPEFWKQIDPYSFLSDISAPIQLQHATGDKSVPVELSRHLGDELKKTGKKVEYFEYVGDDHNISGNSGLAFERAIKFFQENL